jgi:NAD(P)H-flavin reductase
VTARPPRARAPSGARRPASAGARGRPAPPAAPPVGPCADPIAPRPTAITRVIRETPDTLTFRLAPEGGHRFQPGQFNMLYLRGVGELPISISGDPAEPEVLQHTVRAVGGVSIAMQALRKGDQLGIRGPYGNAWPVEEGRGKDVLIVAGGLGLAPLRPAIYHLLANRAQYRRVGLLYGARTPEDMLYPRELERWAAKDVWVQTTVDRRQIGWSGNVGVVTTLFRNLALDPAWTVAMVCGPEVMMRFAIRDLSALGLAHESIWVSMERNMKCGLGLCGQCQYGPFHVCKDGPVFRYDRVAPLFDVREL